MNNFRLVSLIMFGLGLCGFLFGILFALHEEAAFGRAFMIAGAIIIAGFLISSAILQKKN